jgi:hypothetical protein
MALALVGCGGGDEPAEEPAEEAAPAPAPEPTDAEALAPDRSPAEEQTYEPFPTDPEVVPAEILENLEDGQPMMVYFYDDDQLTTPDQDEVVNEMAGDYRGLISLVSYDVGEYVSNDPSGTIEVDPAVVEDETAKRAALMTSDAWLDITFTPYIVLVDEFGYISYRFRGPVDYKTLEREVLRATS